MIFSSTVMPAKTVHRARRSALLNTLRTTEAIANNTGLIYSVWQGQPIYRKIDAAPSLLSPPISLARQQRQPHRKRSALALAGASGHHGAAVEFDQVANDR